ncbi:UDP-N-acetylenolpyruvoylglucosamine reductase [Tenuifilaceae bacterium CYCD]|nr:UDP-N-acetylenolpyruvoylglucosamine reductase [Tenuifilaceae bacterium CYCD]
MRMILLTGANSFIGQHIINELKEYQFEEVSLVDKHPSSIDFSKYNCVIHLAAIVHQKKTISKDLYFRINSDLAYETALAAKKAGIQHFIFFSTIKVYGNGGYQNIIYSELSKCNPVDDYAKSKLEAEKRLFELADDDFVVSIIRPSMVYGKGVKANMQSLINLIKLLPIIPLGNINNSRSMVSISNLMTTLKAIIRMPNTDIYLACDKNQISTTQLVEIIVSLTNKNKRIVKLPKKMQIVLRNIFPKIMIRLIGSFHVDATLTHQKLDIVENIIETKTALKEIFSD